VLYEDEQAQHLNTLAVGNYPLPAIVSVMTKIARNPSFFRLTAGNQFLPRSARLIRQTGFQQGQNHLAGDLFLRSGEVDESFQYFTLGAGNGIFPALFSFRTD
jgi:hypothetical protein